MDAVWPQVGRIEPNADVFVDDQLGQLIVTVEAAGAEPESLRVSVDEHCLVIRGRRSNEGRSRFGSFLQKEIGSGEFLKRVQLPLAIEYENATATYTDGMLVIALPISTTHYHATSRTEIRMIVKRTLA